MTLRPHRRQPILNIFPLRHHIRRACHARQLEMPAALLRAKRSSDNDAEGDDSGRNAHGGAVRRNGFAVGGAHADGLGDGVDDLGAWRRDHVADLVGYA